MSLDQLTDEEKNVLLMLSYYDLLIHQPLNRKSIDRIWVYAKMSAEES